nr:MAG TPA_asm: hypothetical protein [Caudoviricetes sp.]
MLLTVLLRVRYLISYFRNKVALFATKTIFTFTYPFHQKRFVS